MPRHLEFALLDVFAAQPLAGNSLTVFPLDAALPAQLMQEITREMRQFESIFLQRGPDPHSFDARIFTMEEELGFAGHPIIGAAVAMHRQHFSDLDVVRLLFHTPEKTVPVESRHRNGIWTAEMDQGAAVIDAPLAETAYVPFLSAFNLHASDLMPGFPLQVVSTGLPYLILPLKQGIERAAVVVDDLESRLAQVGAKFTYLFDVATREGRSWDNDGRAEDSATGSAAGPVAAYLAAHGAVEKGAAVIIRQGRFVARPSELIATIADDNPLRVRVAGQVVPMGGGALELPDTFFSPG